MNTVISTSPTELGTKHRDFLLLTIFVLTQHGLVERASILLDAMIAAGDSSKDVRLAEAVLSFFLEDYDRTLESLEKLDRIDPIERFGQQKLNERQRMRRYLRAKCLHEIRAEAEARDAIDIYLRRGAERKD